MKVWCVIAIVENCPVASWVLASNPDEATAKTSSRLPEGGQLSIVVPLCPATLSQLERNQLVKLLPVEDGLQFTGKALLELVKIQQIQIARLGKTVDCLTLLANKLKQEKTDL